MEPDDEIIARRNLEEQLEQAKRTIHEMAQANEVLLRELEQLRREAASLRESAREDFDAANNWRRYVASVGEARAALYVVPPAEGESH